MSKFKTLTIITVILVLFGCSKDDDSGVLKAPVATAASDITDNLFVANWQLVDGANSYELQVSTSQDFSSDLIVVDNLPGGQNGVGPVQQNTQYFYKVRASINGANKSDFSNIISLYTIPEAPFANEATDITSNSFTANWSAVNGVEEYQIFVSTKNPPELNGQPLANYEGIVVKGTSLSIEGLELNTVYYYQVKSVSDNRVSVFSNSRPALTSP